VNRNRISRAWVGRLLCGALFSAIAPTALTAQTTYTRVSGGVFDSVAMRPLAGALLQLVSPDNPSRSRSVTSDERGSWAIDSVPLGSYLLGFLHPRLDSLRLESPLLRVDARTTDEIRAMVTIPSARTLVARTCGPTVANDSLGLFSGTVRSSRGEPLAGPARIRAQWLEITLGQNGVERRRPSTVVNTAADGTFAICGVPSEGTFLVRAFAGTDSSGFVEFDAPRNGLLMRDIYIGRAQKVAAPASARTSEPLLRGTGALSGFVRNAAGEPVRGARLVLWGSGLEDTTSAGGQFTMESLPAGTYTLEARALGFLPTRAAVDVPEGGAGSADLVLESFVPVMDTMRIRADRIAALNQLSDFERRRKSGIGYYIDEAAVERRSPMFMSDLLRSTPGVFVVGSSDRRDRVRLRGLSGSGSCIPTVWLNGVRSPTDDGDLEQLVNPQTVRAVEIYSRTGFIPAELQTPTGCGAIVIWTGPRINTDARRPRD
jgi:hypothetical protein